MSETSERTSAGAAGLLDRCQTVLELWLAWHEAQSNITEQLFSAADDAGRSQQILDHCQRLREEAVRKSNDLLATLRCDATRAPPPPPK